jgi:hypothetical protein
MLHLVSFKKNVTEGISKHNFLSSLRKCGFLDSDAANALVWTSPSQAGRMQCRVMKIPMCSYDRTTVETSVGVERSV